MTVTIHKKRPDWALPLGTMAFVPFKIRQTQSSAIKSNEQNSYDKGVSLKVRREWADKPFTKEREYPWTGGEMFVNPDDETNMDAEQSLYDLHKKREEETISEAMERSMTELANKVQAEILAEQQQVADSCKSTETISEALERSMSELLDRMEAEDKATQSSDVDSSKKD